MRAHRWTPRSTPRHADATATASRRRRVRCRRPTASSGRGDRPRRRAAGARAESRARRSSQSGTTPVDPGDHQGRVRRLLRLSSQYLLRKIGPRRIGDRDLRGAGGVELHVQELSREQRLRLRRRRPTTSRTVTMWSARLAQPVTLTTSGLAIVLLQRVGDRRRASTSLTCRSSSNGPSARSTARTPTARTPRSSSGAS